MAIKRETEPQLVEVKESNEVKGSNEDALLYLISRQDGGVHA